MRALTGNAKSTEYLNVAKRLMTRPIKIGERSTGWPEHEVDAIVRARIAGWGEDRIRRLVIDLEAKRAGLAPEFEDNLEDQSRGKSR